MYYIAGALLGLVFLVKMYEDSTSEPHLKCSRCGKKIYGIDRHDREWNLIEHVVYVHDVQV